ncbi:upf0041 domain containing protein [Grosmannia clavigera kw1407]|uniref:Mitochondrial pyruvate carrier n=1 Tax=Grosmannia clavigera (strain kw1407 / UAMH 11150) TaxID=655863 RepID=F0XT67_GROCL|nr:upf0041 domain containing protein [Grosmannia clavigera kw1407]EFW99238.1 upf0041 domain containing protein [Grosmannia clavigera kw1407]
MSPSAMFARTALRPLSGASASASSSFFLASSVTRHMATARPVAAAAARTTAAGAKTALPKFSTASFMAAAFRRASNRSGSHGGRRYQSSTAGADAGAHSNPSIFKRLWDSPVGVKTVHFWAPVLKWVLVLAGISDLARPAEKLSVTQNIALTATGVIWTRWCLIIKPKNYMLAAVNFFLGIVGIIQCTRIFMHSQQVKKAEEAETPAAVEQ